MRFIWEIKLSIHFLMGRESFDSAINHQSNKMIKRVPILEICTLALSKYTYSTPNLNTPFQKQKSLKGVSRFEALFQNAIYVFRKSWFT